MTLSGNQEEPLQQLIQHVLPRIIQRANNTPVQFQDNQRHKIRRQSLEILSMIPYPNNRAMLPLQSIIELLLNVMHDDNEENSDLANKMLSEMQKFYRNTFFALSVLPQGERRFNQFCQDVLRNLPLLFRECCMTQEDLDNQRSQSLKAANSAEGNGSSEANKYAVLQGKYLRPSKTSSKTINQFTNFYIYVATFYEPAFADLGVLFDIVLENVLETFPQDAFKQVKNVPLYIDYLDTLKTLMNFLIFSLKRIPRNSVLTNDFFLERFPRIFMTQITVLKNLTQVGSGPIRKEILGFIKQEMIDVVNAERADRLQMQQALEAGQQMRIPRIESGIYRRKDDLLKQLIDELLLTHVLSGKGKQSKEVVIVSKQILLNFMGQTKDYMTPQQLKISMNITMKALFDSTLPLNIKGHYLLHYYKIFEEMKKKQCLTFVELSEIFESLTRFVKDLDGVFKVLVKEFGIIKSEVGLLKKNSRIRWLNDIEQKNAEIRDLLIADGGAPFVDFSKERTQGISTFDFDRAKQEYLFYYIHEYIIDQTNGQSATTGQDVTRLKEGKYSYLLTLNDNQFNEYIEQFKDLQCIKLVKNILAFIDTILPLIIEKQNGSNFFQLKEMKGFRRLIIYGSALIQHMSDMTATPAGEVLPSLQGQPQITREQYMVDNIRKLAKMFQAMQTLQFRDLISSVEEEFFGHIIEVKATKGSVGIVLLADLMMSFSTPSPQDLLTFQNLIKVNDYPAHLLEIFFAFIVKKMRVFNRSLDGEQILTLDKLDQRLAKIPTPDLQDTIQKLALTIGEKALSRKNDMRMKNLFFSIFIFCIKYTKASKIVPYYFQVIRNLFKMLNNLNDNTNFVKEFIPMIQGLLETFIQAKEEASFIKDTNEICYSVPAKLKNLIEYLPIISRPLIDSMKQTHAEVIESGITTIQMWVAALTSYPEILDPIIENILPELNSLLYRIFGVLPQQSFKLLGKLGTRTRQYFEEKEFRAKNFPEEGLKIELQDKSTSRDIILPLDSVIGTILIKVFDCFHKYPQDKLLQAYKLVKNSFLCFVEPSFEVDYLITSIINARDRSLGQNELLSQYAMNSTRYFDSKRTQPKLSNMSRGSESHGFEKILKSLLIASSIPKNNASTKEVHSKVKRFFSWVTQYFTFICICKNGNLKENLANEISPMIFYDNICEFLYFNVLQSSPKLQQRSYLKGSIRALKITLRTIHSLYPTSPEIFDSLDFIHTLIHKICHIAYGPDLPNKVAMNIALQLVLKELPVCTIKNHYSSFLDALFHVLNISNEQHVHQVEEECRKTLELFLDRVGFYDKDLNLLVVSTDVEMVEQEQSAHKTKQEFQNSVLDKIISQIYSNKQPARAAAMHFLEKIAKKSGVPVAQLLVRVLRPQREQQQHPPQAPQQPPQVEDRTWSHFLIQGQIENKAKQIFTFYKGGYSQILNLITYLDLFQFLLKHSVLHLMNRPHVYMAICDQLIKILEEEVSKFDTYNANDQLPAINTDQNVSLASKSAVKYMKLEKQHLTHNKTYDPYSHTLHPHHFLQNQHFEVEEQAKRDKLQNEFEAIMGSFAYNHYEMYPPRNPQQQQAVQQPEVNPKFMEALPVPELEIQMKSLNTRINDFIKKLFSQPIKASDISYDYIHHMYELYPNHRQHAELMAKSLNVLCDIVTEDSMHAFFKQRQSVYFDQMAIYVGQQAQLQEQIMNEFFPDLAQMVQPQRQNVQAQYVASMTPEKQAELEKRLAVVQIFSIPGIERSPNVNRKIDMYAIEIKSKIIVMFFKFFQREEHIVFKMAKKCLSRLLKKEANQQEALPNLILKECVRPSLNIISQRNSTPALYEELTRLICVLHGCFNEQLGRHLIRCYEQSRPKFQEDFRLHMYTNRAAQGNQPPDSNANTQANTAVAGEPQQYQPVESMTEAERQRLLSEDFDRLVFQQNMRIEEIENAYHITKILYLLLPSNRQEIHKILLQIPEFEVQVLSELEKKFDSTFKALFEYYRMPPLQTNLEQVLRPLAIRVGQLKSNLREGLLKFYNKNCYEATDMLKSGTVKLFSEEYRAKQGGACQMDLILDILKDPASYCLRERFAREPELIKHYLGQNIDTQEFAAGIKIVQILMKFNPQILYLPHVSPITYYLRHKWLSLAESLNIEDFVKNPNQNLIRKSYSKLMNCLINYCRSPKAKLNSLLDLARGYSPSSSLIDMTPIKLFFNFEFPYTCPLVRAKELLSSILVDRIRIPQQQLGRQVTIMVYEINYQYLDLIFMPILTRYTENDALLRQIFDQQVLNEFMETIFGEALSSTTAKRVLRIDEYRTMLEMSSMYSSEQMMIEISKVLNLVFRYFEFHNIYEACPQRDITRINSFLYQCAKKSKTPLLTEWAFYSLTSMYIRILNSIPAQENYTQVLLQMIEQTSSSVLMLVLQHSQNLTCKALVQKSFRNLLQIIESINIQKLNVMQRSNSGGANPDNALINLKRFETVALSLKEALVHEGRQNQSLFYLASFIITNQEIICRFDHKFKFVMRINKIISKIASYHTMSLQQKQLAIELAYVLIHWAKMRYTEYRQNIPGSQEIMQVYYSIGQTMMYYLSRLSIMVQPYQQNESLKDCLDLVVHSLKQIRELIIIFPSIKPQFPFFEKLVANENNAAASQSVQAGVINSGDQENLNLQKVIMLNTFHMLTRYSNHRVEVVKFFMGVILPVSTKFQKGILLSCKILGEIFLLYPFDQEPQREFNMQLKTLIEEDVKRCMDKNVEEVLRHIKAIEDRCVNGPIAERRTPLLSFQEQASAISLCIPHFVIRLIDFMDRESERTGINLKLRRGLMYSDNEVLFFKNLAGILFKVICNFRKQLYFDQSEVAPNKLKIRHTVPHMANLSSTQYTQSDLITFTDDIIDFKLDETNFDMFNKESILLCLQLVVKKLKQMKNEDAITIMEGNTNDHYHSINYTIQYLMRYNTNDYVIEGVRKVIDLIIEDKEEDITRFQFQQKADYIKLMLSKIGELQALMERRENSQQTTILIESIFEQGVRFLEMQSSLQHEYSIRIFEKLFIHSRGKPVKLKQRLFDVFERFNGSSMFKKLQFFFAKHFIEENDKIDKFSFYGCQSQFLDFTLHGFRANLPIKKLKHSSKLFPLSNPDINIENLVINGDEQMSEEVNEYTKIKNELKPFQDQYGKFKGRKLCSLMNCLSEIISMNPNYSQDKMIVDKLLTFLFHQYWSLLLTREEQQYIAESINKYFLGFHTSISMLNQPNTLNYNPSSSINSNDLKKYSFPRFLLEALAGTSPQIRLEPEMLQLIAKSFNLWHVVLPILENHVILYPDNERYFFAMNELYEKLAEGDYIAGLRRQFTKSPETRSMVSYAQHDMWEEINQQFSHFIIYYAEQEGQYMHMDEEQNKSGKYQRQLPEAFFQALKKSQEKYSKTKFDVYKQQNPDAVLDEGQFMQTEMSRLERDVDNASGQRKFESEPQIYQYPRRGPNNKIAEIDLRVWDNLFLESQKVLNKWDQYFDIARALTINVEMPNIEMMIEYFWNSKNWKELAQYESILKKSDSLQHRMYYLYLCIKNQNIQLFDDAFKAVQLLCSNKWDVQFPKYIDNIHFQNLGMYQLIMECSEGGRNLVKEAQSYRARGRLVDIKTAVNIWRERVPLTSEPIHLWKEVLDNRNFIQDQISHIMIPSTPLRNDKNLPESEFAQHEKQNIEQNYRERQRFSNEFLDKAWNYFKLAQISRKQGYPNLAVIYLSQLSHQLNFTYESEGVRYERFKFDFEYIKLQMDYNSNPESLSRFMLDYCNHVEQRYILPYRTMQEYQKQQSQPQTPVTDSQPPVQQIVPPNCLVFEPQQISEIQRLIGEYFFQIGHLDKSQKYFKASLALNKKETKTWLSYAKLNQTVFQHKKDEVSLQLILKSYFSAITLSLHKSRFVIPQILNLIKKRKDLSGQEFRDVVPMIKKNLDQMPTWIWIFWIPHILHMLFSHSNQLEFILSKEVIMKLSKLYPQTLYYSLRTKLEMQRSINVQQIPQDEQQQVQLATQWATNSLGTIKRIAYHATTHLDRFSNEFLKNLKSSQEEELYLILSKILCMSSFLKITNFENDFRQFLRQLHQRFFNERSVQASQILGELQTTYERDFLNPATQETDMIEIIKKLKNIKDFLYMRISLTDQKSYLELISPVLANFNDKGVELPGQFIISELEPLPQNTVYIQKFDPQLHKGSGIATKKIAIRGSNQKQYAFVVTNFNMPQMKDEYNKYLNEERLNQIKLIMNQIFKRHKETHRRGVKFYVPIKALLSRCKMVQDDLQFQSLQEIHDYLFQERGLDPDHALNLQIQKVEQMLAEELIQPPNIDPINASANSSNGSSRMISFMSEDLKQRLSQETYDEMSQIHCKPYLLSSFFHRIFYNVDELFIFKKQFTTYHAVNSFFFYVFNQVEFCTLNQLSVCKTSGCLSFNEAKLIEFLKNKNARKYVQQTQQNHKVDFEGLEKEDMANSSYLPFRLSSNIVEFIGKTGLHGLFAGVMTSCSLAMSKHHEKIIPLINLVYRDDFNNDAENAVFFVQQCIEYMQYKMTSLSQNKQVLNLEHFLDDPDYVKHFTEQYLRQNQGERQMTEVEQTQQMRQNFVKFGQTLVPTEYLKYQVEKPNILEEFNKKVFDLIDIAIDPKHLSQMPSNWNAWF